MKVTLVKIAGMACGSPYHEKMHKNLSSQLALAVRSIQWSYGIFWARSTTEERVLEWRDGYYNGDIKTRKTVQTMETKADKIGLQRSEQLKELFKFLRLGEAESNAKRPSASLSPEDLSDSEWYYLVCMSFLFYPNQSLPGRALEMGETIWLCNAQHADSKVFSRSLLAKSASIQTVVCFPYLGGVIEIGTTELVSEDPNLIQHVKSCFLEFSKPICSDRSSSGHYKPHDGKYPTCTKGDIMALENTCSLVEEIKLDQYPVKELEGDNNNEDYDIDGSPDGSSNGCENHGHMEESMIQGINVEPSHQVRFVNEDDALINSAPDSLSSCDCMSEASETQERASEDVIQIIQDSNVSKHSSLDIEADEGLYYTRTLCAVLGNSTTFGQSPYASNSCHKSSFMNWKIGGISERKRPRLQQSMLKKTLFDVPFMHRSCSSSLKSHKEIGGKERTSKLDNADHSKGNVISDRNRETENFQILKSTIPSSLREVEKISILGNTIKYLKELETRVEELESHMGIADSEAKTKNKCPDVLEQISDNYGARKIYMGMKPRVNKRKTCDIDDDMDKNVSEEAKPLDLKVNMKDKEVIIEMKCPYRQHILYDVMDAIINLHLDPHTVESSTTDGVLKLTLKTKFRGAATAPIGMIKEALSKVSGNI